MSYLLDIVILQFFLGCIFGVIDTWKPRVMFIIWFVLVGVIVTSLFLGGSATSENFPAWGYALTIPAFIFGMFAGKAAFEQGWGK